MIELKGVRHAFGRQTVLQDIDLKLEENRIYGLLGRNGVGKSTLLNLIATQFPPSSGQIVVDGANPWTDAAARGRINLIKESGYGVNLKGTEILNMARQFFPSWDEGFAQMLLQRFRVPVKKYYDKLSRGNQTMLGLVLGLASRSPYTFFDEPSLGLDAANRDEFYRILLEDYAAHPRTVVLSTHLIDEVSNLFEEVIILRDTKILLQQPLDELLSGYFSLQGRAEDVEEALRGRQVLARETLGGMEIAYCRATAAGTDGADGVIGADGAFDADEQARWEAANLMVVPVPLQKLFVLLTEEKEAAHV